MYKILIIEDDDIIANSLKTHLCRWGFEAQSILDFHRVINEFVAYDPQLILMDISLPFFNGYHCTDGGIPG